MCTPCNYWVYSMHSLETGVIVSIAAFFFFWFLSFTFLREVNISKDIGIKTKNEVNEYSIEGEKKYVPELINNIANIITCGGENDDRDNEE